MHRPKYPWAHGEVGGVDLRMPILQPDAVLRYAARSRVVECKYTPRLLEIGPHDGTERFRSPHLQQLFCYLSKEARRERSATGLLLYPRVGRSVRAEVRLGDFPVTIATLDLSRSWRALVGELSTLLFESTSA